MLCLGHCRHSFVQAACVYECNLTPDTIWRPHSHKLLQVVDTRADTVVKAVSDDAALPKTVSHTGKSSLSGEAVSEAIAIEVNHL